MQDIVQIKIGNQGRNGRSFMLALWATLVTIFVCALTPVESASVKLIGSAFDPSTTTVALKGRAQQLRELEKLSIKEDDEPTSIVFHTSWTTSGGCMAGRI